MRHVRSCLAVGASLVVALGFSMRLFAGPEDTLIQWELLPEEPEADSTVAVVLDVDDPDGVASIRLLTYQDLDGAEGYDPAYDVLLGDETRPYLAQPVHVEDATFLVSIPPFAEGRYHFEATVVDGAMFLCAERKITKDVQLDGSYGDNSIPSRVTGWLTTTFHKKTSTQKEKVDIHASKGCKFKIGAIYWADGVLWALSPSLVVDGGENENGHTETVERP